MFKYIKNVLINNKQFRSLIIWIDNRLYKIHSSNSIILENIHCKNNEFIISGTSNSLFCPWSSYIRNCKAWIPGSNNEIEVGEGSTIIGDGKQVFHMKGNNNRIIIGNQCTISGTNFFVSGNDNRIIIGDNVSCVGVDFHLENGNNVIEIKQNCSLHGRDGEIIHFVSEEGNTITLGEDCMISNGIQIRTTDSHSILDKEGRRINPAADIAIGKHCWLGSGAKLLKGTRLANNTVVGAGAICSKDYKEGNCILAGNPARIIKRETNWSRDRL